MAASMDNRVSISFQLFKSILIANIFSGLILTCFIFLPMNSGNSFDLIFNTLSATKWCALMLVIRNVCCWVVVFLHQGHHYKSGGSSKIFSSVVKGCLSMVCSVFGFYFITVLYGAALTEYTAETFHFALLLATAAVLPGLIFLGTNSESWVRVFALNNPEPGMESTVLWTSVGSIIGAWLGAFPIPLDWDRPWQVWPVSCVMGTLLGYVVALGLSTIRLCQQYYRINKLKLT